MVQALLRVSYLGNLLALGYISRWPDATTTKVQKMHTTEKNQTPHV